MKATRGRLLSGVGTALLLVWLAPSPAASWATYPGANGRIAYWGWSGRVEPGQIFTILPDGSGVQQLTDGVDGGAGQPSWSADGQRLVFLAGGVPRDADEDQVFTMRADGGNEVRVTHDNGIDISPHFSPNGRRIVYAKDNLPVADANTPRRVSIFTIRADGTDRRRIVRHYATSPVYSPNGRRIAFDGTPNAAHKGGIWTVRPNGSHLRRLTKPSYPYYDQNLDWSPDGHHILFRRCDDNYVHICGGGPWVMRANGSYKHPIPRGGRVYSPSGDQFATWGGPGEDPPCSDIHRTPITGTGPNELVTHNCDDFDNGGPGGYAAQPSWQPIPGG